MNPISELTSLLWWLMLLSASALILHDIGVGILPAPRPRPPVITSRGTGTREDELKALERRISRAIQRPSSFRTLQKEIAQSITQLALATHGFTMSRVPESQPEMIYDILPDSDLARFVVDQARSSESTALTRNKMLTELNRTIMILERAEAELK